MIDYGIIKNTKYRIRNLISQKKKKNKKLPISVLNIHINYKRCINQTQNAYSAAKRFKKIK